MSIYLSYTVLLCLEYFLLFYSYQEKPKPPSISVPEPIKQRPATTGLGYTILILFTNRPVDQPSFFADPDPAVLQNADSALTKLLINFFMTIVLELKKNERLLKS